MQLPDAAHLGQPWRIHALTPDFRLEDVWALPTEGARDDFPRLVELIAAGDPSEGGSAIARALFAIRWKLGELLAGTTRTTPSPRCATASPPASSTVPSSARSPSARST
jgi:hypothetical protein